MKTKILFVCLGNTCRSPSAEAVFKGLVRKKGVQDKFE
ncbi:MAG TPA: low molecular weight phosphotyrosine protein phosphatase, partial [Bacteroidales bacterium]|nr:low molecular weight phosphotyrosine protein phosphatase [Bacteroidales bacterium]